MGFIRENLKEFCGIGGLTISEFANDFTRFINNYDLDEKNYTSGKKISFTRQTINGWILGKSTPTIRTLDLLHLFAQSRGHEDIKFYNFPKIKYIPDYQI